jgi:hypothetical protein
MDQQSAPVRPSIYKRRWFLVAGAVFLLLILAGGIAWWMDSGRVTATALFQVADSVPSFSNPNSERAMGEYEFGNLKRTQIALLQSDFVLVAALRDPKIGSLPVVQRRSDPVQWLQQKLAVNYPKDGCLLAISLTGRESEKDELAAVVDAIALAYRNEVIAQDRQQRLVTRDMLERNLRNLNEEIRRKLDEYLDIARETGRGDATHDLDQKLKRLDRIEDELMRFENQLAIEVKDTPAKAKLIKQRVAELQKNRDELYATIAKHSEISSDLETRKRNLDCLQSIAADMTTRLEWLDIDASAPDRIRQVQAAIVSPQGLMSRFPVARETVVSSR